MKYLIKPIEDPEDHFEDAQIADLSNYFVPKRNKKLNFDELKNCN